MKEKNHIRSYETSLTKYITLPYMGFKNTFISNLITDEEKRFKLVYSCERKISNLIQVEGWGYNIRINNIHRYINTCINGSVVSYILVIAET